MKIHLIRSRAALAAAAVLLITGLAAGCGHESGSSTGSTPEERRTDTTQQAAALPTVSAAANGTVTQADNDRTTATVSAPPQKTDATRPKPNGIRHGKLAAYHCCQRCPPDEPPNEHRHHPIIHRQDRGRDESTDVGHDRRRYGQTHRKGSVALSV